MDEFQFIESLDALLANEAIDETTTAAVELANSSIAPINGQGIFSGPMGAGQIAASAVGDWMGEHDINMNSSNPFTISLHSNTGLTAPSTTTSAGSAPYPHYASAYIEQHSTVVDSKSDVLGPGLPSMSSSSTDPMHSTSQRPNHSNITNGTAGALSGATSVCSVNSRGSSNASSSRRRESSKSVGSSMSLGSTASLMSKSSKPASRKRARGGTTAVSDSEDDCSKRRYDRNLREQRRSQKITHQIDQLREVLAAASVRFKPDKYSTLVSVVEYVKQLQRRSSMLDVEHKKLIDTISGTNELVNEPYLGNPSASASSSKIGITSNGGIGPGVAKPAPALSAGIRGNENSNGVVAGSGADVYNEDELVFVRNIDYKCIFNKCGMPLAVASIDGRLMDCNSEFVKLTGYSRDELLPNEQYQKGHGHQDFKQPNSNLIADDVGSSFLSDSIFPDKPTSTSTNSANCNTMVNIESHAIYGSGQNATSHTKSTETRNFSLFNLLSRNNMEEVFVSLSEMLKQPPKEDNRISAASKTDCWSGNVRLSRNTHVEMRINVSLVRSPHGRAKFFDCSLTPITNSSV